MGSSQSKIPVLEIAVNKLQNNCNVEAGKYVPPFRRFSSEYHKKVFGKQQESIIKIQQPQDTTLNLTSTFFKQIQQAYEDKSKNFQIQAICVDQYYPDRIFYIVKDLQFKKTITLRSFSQYNTHIYGNIACQVHINKQICSIACDNLLKMTDNYIIQTDLNIQPPFTHVIETQNVAANLAEIIKYRRTNKWEWIQKQFDKLTYDLCNGLKYLHEAGISHNDLRPTNIYYSIQKNCYMIGQFANSVRGTLKGNFRNARTSLNFGAPELNSSNNYDLKKADTFSLGVTLLCAFYLCQPINLQNCKAYNKKFDGTSSMKAIIEMVNPAQSRKSISQILKMLNVSNYFNPNMKNLIESLRFKILPKNKNGKVYKQALSDFYKRLGLWADWKDQIQADLQNEDQMSELQVANIHKQLALIQYCRQNDQESTAYGKRASKIYRQLGTTALTQGNPNLSSVYYQNAISCSKFFNNEHDLDLAKSFIGLSKVHSQKKQYELSKTLLVQARQIIGKQSTRQSLLYSEMKIREAELQQQFGHYEASDQHLKEGLAIALKKQGINQKVSKMLQAKTYTLKAKKALALAEFSNQDKQYCDQAEKNLNNAKNIYESLPDQDCHMQLAQNTEVLGELLMRKKLYQQAKTSFQKASQMRKFYQQQHNKTTDSIQNGVSLIKVAKCQNCLGQFNQALKSEQNALTIFRKIFGSDHNLHSAQVLQQMSKTYKSLNDDRKSIDCLQCSKSMKKDLISRDKNAFGDLLKKREE